MNSLVFWFLDFYNSTVGFHDRLLPLLSRWSHWRLVQVSEEFTDCDDYSNRMFCYSHVDIRCEYTTSIIKLTNVHTEIFDSRYLSYNRSLMGRHSKFLFQNHDFVSHMQSVSDRVPFPKERGKSIPVSKKGHCKGSFIQNHDFTSHMQSVSDRVAPSQGVRKSVPILETK